VARRKTINSSVRGERTLQALGILKAFDRGDTRLLVGATYALRKEPETELRLLFELQDGEVWVGYARRAEGGDWQSVETEPYSLRSYGYWERRLKRIGDFVRNEPALPLL